MSLPINLTRFDLTTLRIWLIAVEQGSLSAAAARLGLSVAAVSKRIAELESLTDMPLLIRSKRGVTPTAAGQALLSHAAEVVAGLERLALAADDVRRGAGGHLRLWANPSAFAGFLPGLLAEYLRRYPGVMMELEETLSLDAIRAVGRGTTELAIVGENTPSEGLQSFLCDRDELVVLFPAGHPAAAAGVIEREAALRFDLVGLSRSTSLMRQLAGLAESCGQTLRIRVQLRNFDAVCRMVSAGIGVAIVPRAAGAPHVKSMGLSMVRFAGPPVERRLLLVSREDRMLSPPALAFVELARNRMAVALNRSYSPR